MFTLYNYRCKAHSAFYPPWDSKTSVSVSLANNNKRRWSVDVVCWLPIGGMNQGQGQGHLHVDSFGMSAIIAINHITVNAMASVVMDCSS